jgi:hypothetical protein
VVLRVIDSHGTVRYLPYVGMSSCSPELYLYCCR